MIQSFWISGRPRPKARPRFFRRGKFISTYSPKTPWEDVVMEGCEKAKPDGVISGAVCVRLYFYFKASKKAEIGGYVTRRVGDCDNTAKPILDCMTKTGWWHDDSQVAWLEVKKTHCDKDGEGVQVTVEVL